MENGKWKVVFLGRQTINGNRRLLFQKTCPSMLLSNRETYLLSELRCSFLPKTFFPYDHEAFSFSYHEKLGHTAARDIFLFFCLGTSISRIVGAGRVDTFPQEGDIEHMTAHITVFDMFLVVYSTMFQKILVRGFLRYQNLKLRFYFLLFQLCSLHIYAGCVPYKNLCWENNHLFLQMRKIFKYIHWQRFNHVHKTKSRRGKMAASSARSASPLSLKMCGGAGA
jgi:hypothetical protein